MIDKGNVCSVTGDGCIFMILNSKACAEMYGERPDVVNEEEYVIIEVTIIKANNEEVEETALVYKL